MITSLPQRKSLLLVILRSLNDDPSKNRIVLVLSVKHIHFPKEKPFKDKPEAKKPVPEIPIEIPKFNPNLFKIPKEKPKPIVRALPPEHDPKYRNTIFGSDVYYRRKKKLDF